MKSEADRFCVYLEHLPSLTQVLYAKDEIACHVFGSNPVTHVHGLASGRLRA